MSHPRSVVISGRAANAAVEVGTRQNAPKDLPYQAAKLRPRVAPGGSPGSCEFCANQAAYAANQERPLPTHNVSRTTPNRRALCRILQKALGVISCSRWTLPQPVLLHPNPEAFPLSGSRTRSFFVCLRRPSCVFVDNSFAVVSDKGRAAGWPVDSSFFNRGSWVSILTGFKSGV